MQDLQEWPGQATPVIHNTGTLLDPCMGRCLTLPIGGWLGNQNEVEVCGAGKPVEKPCFCSRPNFDFYRQLVVDYGKTRWPHISSRFGDLIKLWRLVRKPKRGGNIWNEETRWKARSSLRCPNFDFYRQLIGTQRRSPFFSDTDISTLVMGFWSDFGGWLGDQNEVEKCGTGKLAEKPYFIVAAPISIFIGNWWETTGKYADRIISPKFGFQIKPLLEG